METSMFSKLLCPVDFVEIVYSCHDTLYTVYRDAVENVNIFEYNVVVIPIHLPGHWTVVMITAVLLMVVVMCTHR